MSRLNCIPNTQLDRTNSMGLWTYANEYLNAARTVASSSDRRLSPIPAYYLVCHSIELTLKAFLRGSGEELRVLKKISHDLNRCFAKAEEKGISQYYCLKEPQKKAIGLINGYYGSKELEYISTGFKTFPKYEDLEEIANGLLVSLREYCKKSRNIRD